MTHHPADIERRRAWDRHVAAVFACGVWSGSSLTAYACGCADAFLAERDKRFPPEPAPNDSQPLEQPAVSLRDRERFRDEGREFERLRIAALAEEWARDSSSSHWENGQYALRDFARHLREQR